MANIKFGNGWADARGKVGGVIYSKNKGGSYARNYTKPTNPRTPAQVSQRNIFAYVSSNWRLLTDGQRAEWNYSASQIPVSNKVGEKIHLSGAQYFNKQNISVFVGGGTAIVATPSQLVDILGLISLTATATVTAGDVTAVQGVGMLVDGTTAIPAGHVARVYSTPPLSAGITRPQPAQYVHLDDIDSPGSLTAIDLLALYSGTFDPAGFVDGANIWFKISIINEVTGQQSQALEAKTSYVTA